MEPKKLRGSLTSVYNLNGAIGTEHAVSHTMLLKEFGSKDAGYETGLELRKIYSPVFTAEDDGEVFFQVCLSKVKSVDGSEAPMCQAFLGLVSKPPQMTVHFYSVLTTNLETPFTKKKEGVPYPSTVHFDQVKKWSSFPIPFVVHRDTGFRVGVTYLKVTQVNKLSVAIKPNNVVQPKRCLGTDLLNDPFSSDVTLKANGQEWKVHKCVLMTRSDVFAAMFASDMKENQDGIVEIKDADSKALDLMIKFIYTEAIDDGNGIDMCTTEELLILADKYNLPGLKELCERRLVSQLCFENCLHVCAFARKYNSELLLTSSRNFLAENLARIGTSQTEEFKNFVSDNPDLHIDILRIQLSKEN